MFVKKLVKDLLLTCTVLTVMGLVVDKHQLGQTRDYIGSLELGGCRPCCDAVVNRAFALGKVRNSWSNTFSVFPRLLNSGVFYLVLCALLNCNMGYYISCSPNFFMFCFSEVVGNASFDIVKRPFFSFLSLFLSLGGA